MKRHALVRAAVHVTSITAALTLAVGAGAVLSGAAYADSANSAFQQSARTAPYASVDRGVTLITTTSDGFLYQEQGTDGYLWTQYADKSTHTVPALDGVPREAIFTERDQQNRVAYTTTGTDGATEVVWISMATGAQTTLTLPSALVNPQVSDSYVLVTEVTPGQPYRYVVSRLVSGARVDVPVVLPPGATAEFTPAIVANAGRDFIIRYQQTDVHGTHAAYGILDGLTGSIEALPADADATSFRLGSQISWFSRAGGTAGVRVLRQNTEGATPTIVPVDTQSADSTVTAFLAGPNVVWFEGAKGPLHSVPLSGVDTARVVMDSAEQGLANPNNQDSVTVVGTVGGTRAIYVLREDAGSHSILYTTAVRDLPPVQVADPVVPPGLLARDTTGTLWRYEGTESAARPYLARQKVGGGWQTYNALTSLAGQKSDGTGDVVGRDAAGTLWYYRGSGQAAAPLLARTKVGSGWGVYNSLVGTGDLTGDGRADLVARDASGALWLYRGTGSSAAPFAARTKVGSGWGVYNSLARAGDVTGDGRADLVARDASGALWLYRGTGNSAAPYAARTKVGSGWNVYSALVGAGDLTGDGRADLVARDASGALWLYRGTGNSAAPYAARTTIGSGWNTYNAML